MTEELAYLLPPDDKPAADWTRAELLAFMRANAPDGVDAEALLPVVKRMIADGADPRQLVKTMRGVMASGVDPAQMLAMSSMGALPDVAPIGPPAAREKVGLSDRIRGWFTRERSKKAGIICVWLVVWELLDRLIDNRLVMAGPIRTAQALVEQIGKPDFWMICAASFGRIAFGFLLSFTVGIVLALLAHRFRMFRSFLEPIISLLRTIPVVTFIILLLIWLGNQWLTVFLAFFIVLPIIYTNMIAGFESVDPQMLEMARVFRLPRWRTFMYVYRPAFMPFLVSACKLSLGMSWKSGIMAEVLATPKPSIGKEMAQARTFLDTPDVFAWTVVVMVLSWLFEKLVLWLLGRASSSCGGLLTNQLAASGASAAEDERIGGQPALSLDGVCKAYGANEVLRDVSMRIERGDACCLMAPSGSGKTTLFRVLLGLEPADAGSVAGAGCERASVMFQEDRLCEALTAVQNVALVLPRGRMRLDDAVGLLEEVLPAACLDQPVRELSGGMRRRVSLVRAIAYPGELVVLDEPFTGLDMDTRRRVIDFVATRRAGRALLVATHGEGDAELLGARRIELSALQGDGERMARAVTREDEEVIFDG